MATTVNGICGGQHLDKPSVDGFAGIFGGTRPVFGVSSS